MAGLARPERKAPMKEYNDQITVLDPRRELPSLVRYLSADRLMGIIEEAQNGDTRELFALYRDVISNDNQVRSEFMKRKIAVLGDPVTVIPFKKNDPADVAASDLCDDVIDNATFADAQSWLMNATLFPVAVVEKVFAPLPGGGFALKALVPVHYQLLDYSQGAMRIFDVDDAGRRSTPPTRSRRNATSSTAATSCPCPTTGAARCAPSSSGGCCARCRASGGPISSSASASRS